MKNDKKDNDLPAQKNTKRYTISVGDNLHKRVTKHIQLLKRLESRSHSLQRWICEALTEKLERAEKNDLAELSKDTYLGFNLDEKLHKKVEERVELLKQLRRSYSKKQLLVEAICEKLEREERKVKELLHDLSKSNKSL